MGHLLQCSHARLVSVTIKSGYWLSVSKRKAIQEKKEMQATSPWQLLCCASRMARLPSFPPMLRERVEGAKVAPFFSRRCKGDAVRDAQHKGGCDKPTYVFVNVAFLLAHTLSSR